MNQKSEQQYYPDDEIDLRDLLATLWAGKGLILNTTFIFAVAGVFYALTKPDIFQASALLAPVEDRGGSSVSGQLSGLASLAGVNIGGGGTNKTTIAKEVVQSRAFLTGFIHRHNLSAELMATDAWDQSRQEWVYDKEVYNPTTGEWGPDDEGESIRPTDWDLIEKFKGQISVSENKDNGMITIAVKSQSPVAAQKWTTWLIFDINEHMREQDIQEAEASIDYLENKLQETNIAGMQQIFYQLIESETRTVMLANAQREYVFQTVDPAVVPQEKSEPRRALISVLAAMLGSMLSIFIVFIRAFVRDDNEGETT